VQLLIGHFGYAEMSSFYIMETKVPASSFLSEEESDQLLQTHTKNKNQGTIVKVQDDKRNSTHEK
jgi:hypothetical protein